MMAINEYLSVTGDYSFLDEEISYYPLNCSNFPNGANGKSVLDHLKASLYHLQEVVGIGEHGLVKLGDGIFF